MQNDQTTRKCKKCNNVKEITQFPIYDNKSGSRRHACNSCNAKRVEDHHAKNREWRLECARKRYAKDPTSVWTPKRRKRANELAQVRLRNLRNAIYLKYGNKCNCCGETNTLFLTLDHVNNDGKHMRKYVHGRSANTIYTWIINNNFPDIFQLLCFNCNIGKSRNNGVCPHISIEGPTTIPKGSRKKSSQAHRILEGMMI